MGGTFVLRGGGVAAIIVEIAVIQGKGVKFGRILPYLIVLSYFLSC